MPKADSPAKAAAAKEPTIPASEAATAKSTAEPMTAKPPGPAIQPAAETEPTAVKVSDCVVNDGTGRHVGRAVNGLVCSYHAMTHKSDGTPR